MYRVLHKRSKSLLLFGEQLEFVKEFCHSDKEFCVKLNNVEIKSVSTPYTFKILFVWGTRDKKHFKKISFRHGIWVVVN